MCGVKVAAIGGGTGLSMLLRGLKNYTHNVTAIVTVADDGGSSGRLRNDLGMCAPGDIRNCIDALANSEFRDILNYRFPEGTLKGHSFGNIWLAALNGISGSFEEAVKTMNRQMNVDGEVMPVTNESVSLRARLKNGAEICGESKIGHRRALVSAIDKVEIVPESPEPVQEVIDRLSDAEIIIMGPGSLYTSIIPNLLVDKVVDTIKNSNAVKFYVCNVMTQAGETDNYTASEHLRAIEKHSYEGIVDYVIANKKEVDDDILKRYAKEGAIPVLLDADNFKNKKTKLIEADLLSDSSTYVEHDANKIVRLIMKLYEESNNK